MGDLPQFIVLKHESCPYKFICYESGTNDWGRVHCRGESAFEPYAKIELEPSKTSEKYFHLRFCHSNRYWSRCAQDPMTVAAVLKQPEEDTSKPTCTLFEARIEGGSKLRLTHVQSKSVVGHYPAKESFIVLGMLSYPFTYIDWDTLVIVPKNVAFKGHNGKYLKAIWFHDLPYLKFESEDGNEPECVMEVIPQTDGHFRIKSVFRGKLWRYGPMWIWADSDDFTSDDKNLLFWPIKVDDKRIALRSEANNHFLRGINLDNKKMCLYADVGAITEEAKLTVEELVLERKVENVKYWTEDARIYDEKPYTVTTASVDNYSDIEDDLTLQGGAQVENSTSFTHSFSINIGTSVSFNTGIPCIAEGGITVSASLDFNFEWGTSETKAKNVSASVVVKVPPRSRGTAKLVATEGKCSIPFSYVQKAKRSSDGQYVTTHHNDGIFHGINYYNFRFENFKPEPL